MTEGTSEEQKRAAIIESHKLELEVHKTQATLSGGAVLGIIAITELMVTSPVEWRGILFLSMVALLYSTAYAINTMLSLSAAIMTLSAPGVDYEKEEANLKRHRKRSMLAYSGGLGLSAVFLMLNLFF